MTAGTEKTAGRLVLEALELEGTELVFGLPGNHVLSIYDALVDSPRIRHITTKHENSASLMAETYGRLTHKPGVCLVTAGPGGTNALSGIAQAYTAASPVVLITGGAETTAKKEAFHSVDRPDFLEKIYANVTKRSLSVNRVEDIPETMAQAFSLAQSGRPGPVHVAIPLDVMTMRTDRAPAYRKLAPPRIRLDGAVVDGIVRLLRDARKPVICVGKGVLRSDATRELETLAGMLSVPVVFTQDGTGAISYNHPLCVGCVMTFLGPNPFAFELIRGSDALLVVGMRPSTWNLEPVLANAPKNFIFVGLDDEPSPVPGAAIGCIADNKLALQDLIVRLDGHRRPPDPSLEASIRRNKENIRGAFHASIAAHTGERGLHFGLVVEEVARRMERDGIVVGDIGNHGFGR